MNSYNSDNKNLLIKITSNKDKLGNENDQTLV